MAVAWNELGNAYLQNNSKKEAEGCYRKSVDALEILKDANANTKSMPWINLGFVLHLQGRLDEAESAFRSAIDIRESVYGPNDRESFA